MSVQHDWRKALLASGLPSMTKLTLLVVSEFMDEHGACFPSQSTLARLTSLTDRAVRLHLRAAELSGWVVASSVGRGRGNRYEAAFPEKNAAEPRNDIPGRNDIPPRNQVPPRNETPEPRSSPPEYHSGVPRNHVPTNYSSSSGDPLTPLPFSQELLRIIGSPSLTSTRHASEWERWGADESLILAVVEDTMQDLRAKGKAPPSMLKYFDSAIKRAIDMRRPTPASEPRQYAQPARRSSAETRRNVRTIVDGKYV